MALDETRAAMVARAVEMLEDHHAHVVRVRIMGTGSAPAFASGVDFLILSAEQSVPSFLTLWDRLTRPEQGIVRSTVATKLGLPR